MLRVVLKAGAREDLGTVDSSMSGFLWFDKQSVRWLAAKVAMSLHRPIVLSICRGERVKELKELMSQGLKLMSQRLKFMNQGLELMRQLNFLFSFSRLPSDSLPVQLYTAHTSGEPTTNWGDPHIAGHWSRGGWKRTVRRLLLAEQTSSLTAVTSLSQNALS
jgi:hypothetical protein